LRKDQATSKSAQRAERKEKPAGEKSGLDSSKTARGAGEKAIIIKRDLGHKSRKKTKKKAERVRWRRILKLPVFKRRREYLGNWKLVSNCPGRWGRGYKKRMEVKRNGGTD